MTLGLVVAASLFLNSSRTAVVLGHDTVVRPTTTGDAVIQTGPLLPDLRIRDIGPVGVTLTLGKTEVGSVEELVERYAFIASDPTAQVDKVQGVVVDMAVSAAVRGLGVGLLPVAVFLLLGRHRRGQLFRGLGTRQGVLALALLLTLPVLIWQPWETSATTQEEQGSWQTLAEFAGPDVVLPDEVRDIEVRTGPVTTQSKRLVLSAIDTYDKSKEFYSTAADGAADLDLREPQEGETVALLVSDRHDNIGMDRVALAIGEAAGATVVLDAGDDTSTGQPWEAFSLDSLAGTFADWDRFAVAGNHDDGAFVRAYLAEEGWTMLDGEAVDAPWGGTHHRGRRPAQQRPGQLARRVWPQLHRGRRTAGRCRLRRHGGRRPGEHRPGPRRQPRPRGARPRLRRPGAGWPHARAGRAEVRRGRRRRHRLHLDQRHDRRGGVRHRVGSKPRRDADVSLVTYADGRPTGLQWVRLRTDGTWLVGEWKPITPAP